MSAFETKGILVSKQDAVIKETRVTKLKFKITSPGSVRSFARALQTECKVDGVISATDSTSGNWSYKVNTKEYCIYLKFCFGTELENITEFDGQLVGASFSHSMKEVKEELVEKSSCTIEILKERDTDADFKLGEYIKRTITDEKTNKKILVTMVLSADPIPQNPIIGTEI